MTTDTPALPTGQPTALTAVAPPVVRPLGRLDYEPTLQAMREFTASRTPVTPDEIWLVEHPPVFTLGLASRAQHLHGTGTIPVVRTERGGQVTYHGPGQVLAYLLLDLRRRGLMVRDLVCRIEAAAIDCLAEAGISGLRKPGAKIVALGLKISRGCSYHGLALNVDMDLSPFDGIDPCGYPGLAVTDLRHAMGNRSTPDAHGGAVPPPDLTLEHWGPRLAAHLIQRLG